MKEDLSCLAVAYRPRLEKQGEPLLLLLLAGTVRCFVTSLCVSTGACVCVCVCECVCCVCVCLCVCVCVCVCVCERERERECV